MAGLAQAKGLGLTSHILIEVPPLISGDPIRLQQILVNLLGNAIKFTPHGQIRLTLFRPNDAHLAIQVADTGVGIPGPAQARIFEAFEQHNRIAKLSSTNHSQIVIIEDDEHIAAIFTLAFEKAGHAPLVISDGQAAMECLLDLNITPRLIILDLHLPFVSGREVLAYLEATQRLVETTTVIVSADQLEVEQLKNKGHQALLKPIGFRQMYEFALTLNAAESSNPPQ